MGSKKKTPSKAIEIPDTLKAPGEPTPPPQPVLNRALVAYLLDLDPSRITQLKTDGTIALRPGAKYGAEAVRICVRALRSRADARDQSSRGQIEAEKLRALKRENDLAESRLFTSEVLDDALAKIVAAWVRILDAVPVQWKRKFPATTGDELDQVKRFVADMRNELADAAVNTQEVKQ